MASRVVDWFTTQIRERRARVRLYPNSPQHQEAAQVMELEALLEEVKKTERGLVLACRDVARLKLIANRDATGEDFGEEHVRLAGADEMREVMLRLDRGEMPV